MGRCQPLSLEQKIIFSDFCRKLHQNKNKIGPREGAGVISTPLDPPIDLSPSSGTIGQLFSNTSEVQKCNYCPPTKLRECNVFTGVCLSMGGQVSLVTSPFRGGGRYI